MPTGLFLRLRQVKDRSRCTAVGAAGYGPESFSKPPALGVRLKAQSVDNILWDHLTPQGTLSRCGATLLI